MSTATTQPAQPSSRQIARLTEVPSTGRSWPRGLPTRAGMGMTAMLVLLGFVAANPGLNLLLLLFGLGIGLMLCNALMARWQVRLAEVRRILPDVAAVGRPTTVRYEIRNSSRWMGLHSLWIVDGYTHCPSGLPTLVTWVRHVPRLETVVAEIPFVPTQRGLCGIEVMRLASKFPFGLYKRLRVVRQPGQLLVWPALWRPRTDWLGRTPQLPAAQMARQSHRQRGTEEFFGIREYRPGDNVRWIHWRRSASLDRVVVREMVDANSGRMTLALETTCVSGPADQQTLDRLVSAAASLACDALENGWHVGLILNGTPTVMLPPASGHAVRTRLLYELAIAAPGKTRRLADILNEWPAGPRWAGRSVLLHPQDADDDPSIHEAARRLGILGPVAILPAGDIDRWFDVSRNLAAEPGRTNGTLRPPLEPAATQTGGNG